MFFTSDDTCAVNDHVFDAASNLKYFAKTRKFLKMQRIFIKPRTEVLGDSEDPQCIPNFSTLKQAGIPLRYYEQGMLLKFILPPNKTMVICSTIYRYVSVGIIKFTYTAK